jgi:FdrA protein
MLDDDPGTELVVLVSKPPAPEVEAEVRALAEGLSTPVHLALLGPGRPDLTALAADAVRALGRDWQEPRSWPAPEPQRGTARVLRGAFAGGTLCDEAMLLASAALGPIASNIPLDGAPRLGSDLDAGGGHAMVDFGDDELTRGRPHPMIDMTLRADWIARQAREAAATGTGTVLLLDVVLGHGAHPDPASELAPVLEAASASVRGSGADLAVVVSLCGTDGDPQGLQRQALALQAAGASVHLSNAAAARKAVELLADDVQGAR